jgi:UDP:flavonoid glycosyltransferase YjiC (YdhE family)
MLVVPFAHDQPDNAARIVRLGVGAAIGRDRYTAARAAAALAPLLNEPAWAARAAGIGAEIAREDGVAAACRAIEAVL